MSKFAGGSAYAMARDIGEGYISVTERTFKKLNAAEVRQLTFEIDRFLRELRGTPTAGVEQTAVQARNRKIQRLNSANLIARMYRQRVGK